MNNTSKFLSICLFALMFFVQKANSQTTVGASLAYGSEIETVGININGQYFITNTIAIAPAFTYYFPSTAIVLGYKRKWYEINVDANYYPELNLVDGKLKPYGLVGANYSIVSFPYYNNYTNGDTVSKFGVNIGAGADFSIGKKITPFGQLKYTLSEFNQLQILVGIRFAFK